MEAKELQQKMYSGMEELDFASHWFEEEVKVWTSIYYVWGHEGSVSLLPRVGFETKARS